MMIARLKSPIYKVIKLPNNIHSIEIKFKQDELSVKGRGGDNLLLSDNDVIIVSDDKLNSIFETKEDYSV